MKPNKTIRSMIAILRLAVVFAIIVGLLPLSQPVQAAPAAQTDGPQSGGTTGTYRGVSTAVQFDISRPLRELAAEAAPLPEGVFIDLDPPGGLEGPLGPQDVDTAVQSEVGSGEMPAPIVSFDAISNQLTYTPPDPVGDVGPNHYVVMSNVHFSILDKAGNVVVPPAPNNSLWAGFGGPCQNENSGDPIVVYDQLADRWMLTQFTSAGPTYYNCVALSTSGDPASTYYRWAFTTGVNFPDYPKYGVWPDAYYISTREFGNNETGAYALNRAQMLAGNPAPQVISFLAGPGYNVGDGLLPTDIDGMILPPAGTPNFYVGTTDNGGPYGAPSDALTIWEFHVDWVTPGNSTFALVNTLPVDPFDSMFPCSPTSRECIPQPGTAVKIDILSYRQRPTWRLAYRNFGTHEALVTNQSVEAATGIAGVRWYEIRDPNGTPVVYQQGTYAPGVSDGIHRWMGSIAMDQDGNMALGYSASAATGTYPSSWYTGRLAGDPLGTMPQGEGVIINGGGSQLSTGHRWGDYTSMNVDPIDDCTFWYVNEYFQTSGTSNWILRVGAFKFPNCGSGAPMADLEVEKTASSTLVAPGGDITYTITATNNGPDMVVPFTVTTSLDNPTNITIPAAGQATPYPSVISVPGLGPLVDVNATLVNLSHTWPDDIDIILVGPGGQNSYLMSDAGGSTDISNVTLTFDDAAASGLPDAAVITAGSYQPTNFGTPDAFPAPAPAGPYGTLLSAFNGTDPSGDWSLYVVDAFSPDSGSISGGWSLELSYLVPGVTLTDTLPAGFTFAGGLAPGWSCTIAGQIVTCTSPTMPVGQSVIEVYGTAPASTGYITNTVEIAAAGALDPNTSNNTAEFPILVDTAPLAVDDSYDTDEDTALVVPAALGVLDNDSDADGDPLDATLLADVSNGTLALNADGSFTYTPDANYYGPDQFTYSLSDGYLTDTATVLLDVLAVNDAPVAEADAYSTPEDTLLSVAAPGPLANDTDLEGDTLSAALFAAPAHGDLNLNGDGSFTYTPTLNYNGQDTFTYTVSDGTLTDTAAVVITIGPVNDAPMADAGADQGVLEGEVVTFDGSFIDPGLLLAGETFAWDFGDGATMTGTLTPAHTYVDNGVFTVTLTVTDTEGGVGTDWLLVTVDNAAPVLGAFADQTLTEGETLTISGALSDAGVLDTQTVVIEWEAGVTETLNLAAGETGFEASHLFAAAGTYTVTVTLTDKDGGEAVQTFEVTVNPSVWEFFLPVISNQ